MAISPPVTTAPSAAVAVMAVLPRSSDFEGAALRCPARRAFSKASLGELTGAALEAGRLCRPSGDGMRGAVGALTTEAAGGVKKAAGATCGADGMTKVPSSCMRRASGLGKYAETVPRPPGER
ncbi:hypothetical protein [Pseudonocardia sp.]|uniref:hypothetical protein n=1 Tax=Pseudonocardia sp. TaxID=60912 RepID=UPI002F3E2079